MEIGNNIAENEEQYDIDTYPLFRKRLMQLIKENGYTKQSFANAMGIDVKTYYNWRKGISRKYPCKREYVIPGVSTLVKIAKLFNVSIDYLLGLSEYRSVENDLIGKVTGLRDKALIGIEKINEQAEQRLYAVGQAKKYGYDLAMPGTETTILGFLLGNEEFGYIISEFINYFNTPYNVPVFYDEKSKQWIAPQNKYACTKDFFGEDKPLWFLNVASDKERPYDCFPIALDKDFFERVSMDKIKNHMENLKLDYLYECECRARAIAALKEAMDKNKTTP